MVMTGGGTTLIQDENVVEMNGQTLPVVFGMRSCTIFIRVIKPFNASYRCAILTKDREGGSIQSQRRQAISKLRKHLRRSFRKETLLKSSLQFMIQRTKKYVGLTRDHSNLSNSLLFTLLRHRK
jgi:hypothetical protein